MGDVTFPFSLRGKVGDVHVTLNPNDDPARLGCDLLDPSIPADAARGFPVCEATPAIDLDGYAGACGWIQLVRSSDTSGEYELDPLSLFRGVETPFAFFGVKPVLFDAPYRADHYDLSWTARSFLCAIPDAVMSKVVEPLLGFEWGFAVEADAIAIAEPSQLPPTAWNAHVSLLQRTYPTWTFATVGVA